MPISNFRPWDIDSFLHSAPDKPVYLAEPIIPLGGKVLLHGKRGLGKTQLALSLAYAVASGGDFLGFPCRQGPVALFQADMPENAFLDRLVKARHVLAGLPIYGAVSDYQEKVEKWGDSPPEAVKKVQEACPALVIVDSLRKTHELDENDSDTPSKVYGAWRRCFPKATLCFLHHDRKTSQDALAIAGEDDEAFRGSGAWLDEVDTGLHIYTVKRDGRRSLWVAFSKIRTAADREPIRLVLNPRTLLVDAISQDPEVEAVKFIRQFPSAKPQDVVEHLMAIDVCGKSKAYDVVRTLIQEKE